MVKSSRGHPQRSQHAFVIPLATPVLGSQIADLAGGLKSLLGMNDPLLRSLTKDNLYLQMLNEFRQEELAKEGSSGCRPVHLHAAVEEKHLGPLLIVRRDSAAEAISQVVNSPIVGFALNHSEIAKPTDNTHEVYRWTLGRVEDEYTRLAAWNEAHRQFPEANRLCDAIPFNPERD